MEVSPKLFNYLSIPSIEPNPVMLFSFSETAQAFTEFVKNSIISDRVTYLEPSELEEIRSCIIVLMIIFTYFSFCPLKDQPNTSKTSYDALMYSSKSTIEMMCLLCA